MKQKQWKEFQNVQGVRWKARVRPGWRAHTSAKGDLGGRQADIEFESEASERRFLALPFPDMPSPYELQQADEDQLRTWLARSTPP